MSRRHRLMLFSAAMAAAGLPIAAAAWACVPQPRLVAVLPHASGPSGMAVTVQGVGFDPPPARTEIRWNSPDGPELGRAEQADFAVAVTIPDAPSGLYGVLVMSRGADGVLGNTARATFQVTGPRQAPAPAQDGVASSPAPIPTAPGPTFAPASTSGGSSGPSGLTLGLGAVALVALGVFIGTFLRDRRGSSTPPAEPVSTGAVEGGS